MTILSAAGLKVSYPFKVTIFSSGTNNQINIDVINIIINLKIKG